MKPQMVIIAGPNGSGKTSLTRILRERGFDFGEYINPDDIALELTGSYEERVHAAQEIADQRRDACLREQRDFAFETVMSHGGKLEIMERARIEGFEVTLFFVGTEDPRINVGRVRNRVALGGHDVPEDRIIARYWRTMGFLYHAVSLSDRAFIYDNSDLNDDKVPAGPILKVCFRYNPRELPTPFDAAAYFDEMRAAFFELNTITWIRKHLFLPTLSDALSTQWRSGDFTIIRTE